MSTKTVGVVATVACSLLLAGCAGGEGDDRRAGSLEQGAIAVSWQGDWIAEAKYEAGSMVTHEGSTFVAATATDQPPDAKCEGECAWTVTGVAEDAGSAGQATIAELKVFEYSTGYEGPIESPAAQIGRYSYPYPLLAELPRIQQEIEAWLADIAPFAIRHREDEGSVVAERELPAGNYVVFTRGVFVTVPGLGKTHVPQASTPTAAALVSGAWGGKAIAGAFGKVFSVLGNPVRIVLGQKHSLVLKISGEGGVVQEEALACSLSAGSQVLDTASMTLGGTANATLMGLAALPSGGKAAVSCSHNGQQAGPFVRDLRLVAIKLT